MAVSIGKTAEEIHADLVAEGQQVTLGEVEEGLEAMETIGFVQRADLSIAEAVAIADPNKRGQLDQHRERGTDGC